MHCVRHPGSSVQRSTMSSPVTRSPCAGATGVCAAAGDAIAADKISGARTVRTIEVARRRFDKGDSLDGNGPTTLIGDRACGLSAQTDPDPASPWETNHGVHDALAWADIGGALPAGDRWVVRGALSAGDGGPAPRAIRPKRLRVALPEALFALPVVAKTRHPCSGEVSAIRHEDQ
jgi:hypothetical protein